MVEICFKCNKTFRDMCDLKRHQERKKLCIDDISYQCNNCFKSFTTNQQLTNHMNKKTPCLTNTTINSHHHNSNSYNNTIHIINNYHINGGDKEYKRVIMSQIVEKFKFTSINLIRLAVSNDKKDNLNNICDIVNLINVICFDINESNNWRFIYDNMNKILKMKVKNRVVDFKDNFLEFVYNLYKEVIQSNFIKESNSDIIVHYANFIEEYENHKYDDLNINEFLNECHTQLECSYKNLVTNLDDRIKNKDNNKKQHTPTIIGDYLLSLFGEEDMMIQLNKQTQCKQAIKFIVDGVFEKDIYYDPDQEFAYKSLQCTFKDVAIYEVFIYLFKMIYLIHKPNGTIRYMNKSLQVYLKGKQFKQWKNISIQNLLTTVFKKMHEFNDKNGIRLTPKLYDEYQIKYEEDSDDSDNDSNKRSEIADMDHLHKYELMIKYLLSDNKFDSMTSHKVGVY